jgi:signal transduction histidine kinase
VAFLVSYGQQRLLRLSSLVSVFDETTSTVGMLRQALRVNLSDPELELAVWSDADTADYDARQRIVADLHDGAQKELCGLLVTLSMLRRADDASRAGLLEEAGRRADEALRELRDLAHGVYPQTLTHAGLSAAIVEAADRLDLLVRTTTPDHRLPPALEKSIYFFCCEALTNASKHANAMAVNVVIRHQGAFVMAQVQDDGAGGADPQGPGLARLHDRIEAHGGQMTVHSPAGGGTLLTARMPCV